MGEVNQAEQKRRRPKNPHPKSPQFIHRLAKLIPDDAHATTNVMACVAGPRRARRLRSLPVPRQCRPGGPRLLRIQPIARELERWAWPPPSSVEAPLLHAWPIGHQDPATELRGSDTIFHTCLFSSSIFPLSLKTSPRTGKNLFGAPTSPSFTCSLSKVFPKPQPLRVVMDAIKLLG